MMSIDKQFQHLKINLEAIILATNNFSEDYCIGAGGFGKVYKGDLLLSARITTVALKRLDHRTFGQGDSEFWKEVIMLSLYSHANIISLLGFCDEKGEKILVYEYLSRKGLHLYLDSNQLTWVQRLKICIGAAHGLAYLHDPDGKQQRVLHRDIKSSNILLAENWDAKIAVLVFPNLVLLTNNIHLLCRIILQARSDTSGLLTKESDVYSFGVTLFEVLCGRLCFAIDNKRQSFTELVRESCKENNLDGIICDTIKDEIDPSSLEMFSKIAYQCLKRDRKKRPLMTEIVTQIEIALKYQVCCLFFHVSLVLTITLKACHQRLKPKDRTWIFWNISYKEALKDKGLLNIEDNFDQDESVPEPKVNRKIPEDCMIIKTLLRHYKVFYEERDVSMDLDFKKEVSKMLGTNAALPGLFIRGRYIRGSEEVSVLHDQGKFQSLLEDWPCQDCDGVRFVVCSECSGSHKLYSGSGHVMKCKACNVNGLIRCPNCF
ncbi:hypothetical protein LXL04_038622 [Taraxacum kok-saghyz]